jgi:hypothetical protein
MTSRASRTAQDVSLDPLDDAVDHVRGPRDAP